MIELKNVTKRYSNNRVVLDKISVKVDQGEFVYLIGPSGAGKTTILKLLIGEIKPTSGKILYRNHHVQKFSSKQIAYLRREVRIVFQDFKILFDRTLLENVMLSLYILGKNEKEAKKEAIKALELVHIEDKKDMFPIQVSAGELQRTAIARAIAGDSKVLLADEPTGNLDPATGDAITTLLEEINAQGTTVIVATHNANMVNKTKRRVVEIGDGTIIRDEKKGGYRVAR